MTTTRKLSIIMLVMVLVVATLAPMSTHANTSTPLDGNDWFYPGRHTDSILARGVAMENRPHVFSKIGDSITADPRFLATMGHGGVAFGDHGHLEETFNFFKDPYNSFTNQSVAAHYGWTSGDVLTPDQWAPAPNSGGCQPEETALECEYRIVQPAVALIMLGTNDILRQESRDRFYDNIRRILDISIQNGVVPVISTIPDLNIGDTNIEGRVYEFNGIIHTLANEYGVPLWDYWAQLQPLPNRGLSNDGIHPSAPEDGETGLLFNDRLSHGFTMRNLGALQMLHNIRPHLQ